MAKNSTNTRPITAFIIWDSAGISDTLELNSLKSITNGHITLSKDLEQQKYFPAIDHTASISRHTPSWDKEDRESAARVRKLVEDYTNNRNTIKHLSSFSEDSDIRKRLEETIRLMTLLNQHDNQQYNKITQNILIEIALISTIPNIKYLKNIIQPLFKYDETSQLIIQSIIKGDNINKEATIGYFADIVSQVIGIINEQVSIQLNKSNPTIPVKKYIYDKDTKKIKKEIIDKIITESLETAKIYSNGELAGNYE